MNLGRAITAGIAAGIAAAALGTTGYRIGQAITNAALRGIACATSTPEPQSSPD